MQGLPPGFELDQPSNGLPPGFELDAATPSQPQQRGGSMGLAPLLAQGASFGFADEITSGLFAGTVGTGKGIVNAVRERDFSAIPKAIGAEFQDLQEFQRQDREATRAANPIGAFAAEATGALATGGVGVIKAGRLGGNAAAAATGAVQGAAYGAGATTGGLQERAQGAAVGAGIGAAGGAALNSFANKAASFFGARGTDTVVPADAKRAASMLRNALSEDLGGRSKAEAALRVWRKNGGKSEELFDISGPTTQNLIREIASRQPTPALKFIGQIKDAQSAEIRGQIGASINKRGGSVGAARNMLETVRTEQAAPLYDAAYAKQINTEEIADLLTSRPELQSAFRKGVSRVLNRGNAVTTPDGMITVEVLDRAKGALDDRINTLMRSGAKREAADIIAAKRALVSRIDELAPEYAEARRVWAGTAEIEDALMKGKEFLNSKYTADDLARDLADMGPSEREFHKVAVAEEFEALIDRTRDQSNKGAFISTEAMRKKIRALFADDPNEAEAFINLIQRSEEKFRRLGEVAPNSGSPTSARLRAKEIFDESVAGPLERGTQTVLENPAAVPSKTFKAVANKLRGDRGKRISELLSQALFEDAPQALDRPPPAQIPFRPLGPQTNVLLQDRE